MTGDMRNSVLCGDALSVLKTLADESVNCIVTSPPYYGLRDYQLEPIVWDDPGNCEHVWNSKVKKGISGGIKSEKVQIKGEENFQIVPDSNHAFCSLCGAWRGSLGLEPDFHLYLKHMMQIMDELKRVLRKDGTFFLNMGDSYGSKISEPNKPKLLNRGEGDNKRIHKRPEIKGYAKSMLCLPERLCTLMVDSGWILRNKIVWYKPNCLPSSATDRFTNDFEPVYFFTKSGKYAFERQFENAIDSETTFNKKLIKQPHKLIRLKNPFSHHDFGNAKFNPLGRNMRTVWRIPSQPYREAHFATYPEELVRRCIKAGCPESGIVLDPFAGSGTTGAVAKSMNRDYILIEPNPEYIKLIEKRLRNSATQLTVEL